MTQVEIKEEASF